jgi:hypothetical protein
MELAQDRVQWWALILVVLNLLVLLPESYLVSKIDLRETVCEKGRWMELAQEHVAMAGFDISGVESSGSATRKLVS